MWSCGDYILVSAFLLLHSEVTNIVMDINQSKFYPFVTESSDNAEESFNLS